MLEQEKDLFRRRMRQIRDLVPAGKREELACRCLARLEKLAAYQEADLVYAFASIGSEIPTEPMIRAALKAGKRVALPRVEGRDLFFYEVHSLDHYKALKNSRMGIPEPERQGKAVKEPGIMLVPGLAFDSYMNRIGYGGGFYDRYLTGHRGLVTAWIGYQCQYVDRIPSGSLDRPLDHVITDENTYPGSGRQIDGAREDTCPL